IIRNRVITGVALIGILKLYRLLRLIAGDNHIGNPRRHTLIIRAKVRMQRFFQTDAGNENLGTRIDRRLRDIGVPGIIGRKDAFAVEAGLDAQIRQRFLLLAVIGPREGTFMERKDYARPGDISQECSPGLLTKRAHLLSSSVDLRNPWWSS